MSANVVRFERTGNDDSGTLDVLDKVLRCLYASGTVLENFRQNKATRSEIYKI